MHLQLNKLGLLLVAAKEDAHHEEARSVSVRVLEKSYYRI